MKNRFFLAVFTVVVFAGVSTAISDVYAGVGSMAVRETTEFLTKKFGKEVAKEGAENISKRLAILASKHGDEVVCTAVRKVGPKGITLMEKAGSNADVVAKLLGKHGNEAVWVVSKPKGMALFVKYGDDAAEAMIKHGEAAMPVIDKFGKPAVNAMSAVSKQNGRRIAMMTKSGELTKIGHSDKILEVVGQYGDKGMDFIWRNKEKLAVAAILTTFLLDPEPYIDGIKSLGGEVITPVTTQLIKSFAIPVSIVAGIYILLRWKPWRRRSTATP